MSNIVIIGQGNIGLRHGESVLKSRDTILEVRDSIEVLKKARDFYSCIQPRINSQDISYVEKNDSFASRLYELGIIATDSSNRFSSLVHFSNQTESKFVFLEKPLSNRIDELQDMKTLIGNKQIYFVNLPRETMRLYLRFKNFLTENSVEIASISVLGGNLGLASNLIHYLRLIEFLTDSPIEKINELDMLKKIASKRVGYFELLGTIGSNTESGVKIEIKSIDAWYPTTIRFEGKSASISIVEESGEVDFNGKKLHFGKLEYQSNLTLQSLRQIQNNQRSLPTFSEVYGLQVLILKFFRKTNLYDKSNGRIRFS